MAQRSAFAGSPENVGWNTDSSSRSGIREKVGTGVMLGPFGTEVGGRGSGSVGRPSVGESTTGSGSRSWNASYVDAPASLPATYGNAGITGLGNRYSRVSEGDENMEYMGAGAHGTRSTAHSSMEDLLGGNEPSFFSVVLNPRRTLRVVNLD